MRSLACSAFAAASAAAPFSALLQKHPVGACEGNNPGQDRLLAAAQDQDIHNAHKRLRTVERIPDDERPAAVVTDPKIIDLSILKREELARGNLQQIAEGDMRNNCRTLDQLMALILAPDSHPLTIQKWFDAIGTPENDRKALLEMIRRMEHIANHTAAQLHKFASSDKERQMHTGFWAWQKCVDGTDEAARAIEESLMQYWAKSFWMPTAKDERLCHMLLTSPKCWRLRQMPELDDESLVWVLRHYMPPDIEHCRLSPGEIWEIVRHRVQFVMPSPTLSNYANCWERAWELETVVSAGVDVVDNPAHQHEKEAKEGPRPVKYEQILQHWTTNVHPLMPPVRAVASSSPAAASARMDPQPATVAFAHGASQGEVSENVAPPPMPPKRADAKTLVPPPQPHQPPQPQQQQDEPVAAVLPQAASAVSQAASAVSQTASAVLPSGAIGASQQSPLQVGGGAVAKNKESDGGFNPMMMMLLMQQQQRQQQEQQQQQQEARLQQRAMSGKGGGGGLRKLARVSPKGKRRKRKSGHRRRRR